MDIKTRIIDKMFSGRFLLLIMFGATLCGLSLISLISVLLVKDPQLVSVLLRVLDTLIGFIAGAFTTMWNNYSFRNDRADKPAEKPTDEKGA